MHRERGAAPARFLLSFPLEETCFWKENALRRGLLYRYFSTSLPLAPAAVPPPPTK